MLYKHFYYILPTRHHHIHFKVAWLGCPRFRGRGQNRGYQYCILFAQIHRVCHKTLLHACKRVCYYFYVFNDLSVKRYGVYLSSVTIDVRGRGNRGTADTNRGTVDINMKVAWRYQAIFRLWWCLLPTGGEAGRIYRWDVLNVYCWEVHRPAKN